jgi:hypothetical protein
VQRAAIGLVEAAADGRFESGVLILSHVGSGIEQQKLNLGAVRKIGRLVDEHPTVLDAGMEDGHGTHSNADLGRTNAHAAAAFPRRPHRARETIRFARKSRELLTFLDEEKRFVS